MAIKEIRIDTLENLKSILSKSQIEFFIEKSKNAMDAYEQLIEIREKCGKPYLAEKVYGEYIFTVYRSIWRGNKISNKKLLFLNYEMFLENPPEKSFFGCSNKKYKRLHKRCINSVDQLYVHTDLQSKYKTIDIRKNYRLKSIKVTESKMRIEQGIAFDGITRIVNFLATVHSNLKAIADNEEDNKFIFKKYRDGGWISVSS